MKETLTALARVALRWVLWSRRRLAAVAVAVLVGVFLLGAVSSGSGRHSTAQPTTVTTTAPTTVPTTAAITTTTPATTTAATAVVKPSATAVATTRTAPAPAAVVTATRFVRAWSTPRPAKAWLAALTPLVTKRYLTELRTVNPQNVPAMKLTGPGKVVRRVQGTASVEIPTSRSPLFVNVVGGLVDNVATA